LPGVSKTVFAIPISMFFMALRQDGQNSDIYEIVQELELADDKLFFIGCLFSIIQKQKDFSIPKELNNVKVKIIKVKLTHMVDKTLTEHFCHKMIVPLLGSEPVRRQRLAMQINIHTFTFKFCCISMNL
jgi:preprotein translocase subunit YajC